MKRSMPFQNHQNAKLSKSNHLSRFTKQDPKKKGAVHVSKSHNAHQAQDHTKEKKSAAQGPKTSHQVTVKDELNIKKEPPQNASTSKSTNINTKTVPVSKNSAVIDECLVKVSQFVRNINAYTNLTKRSRKRTMKAQSSNVESQMRHFISVVSRSLPQLTLADKQQKEDLIEIVNDTLLDRSNLNMDMIEGLCALDSLDVQQTYISIPKIRNITTREGPQDLCKVKPQVEYEAIKVDNSFDVFMPKLSFKENSIVPYTLTPIYVDDIHVGYENPYASEIMAFKSNSHFNIVNEQMQPPPVDVTKVTMVNDAQQLNVLLEHLESVPLFAVDLEHHNYRSYLGLTCLMQITTETGGDFIVDVFKVWDSMHLLNRVFTRQNIVKVFHGAKSDICWLQRDFNIYVVGMFDTYEAAKLLKHSQLSLAHLLAHYCHYNADKKYQLYDWRVRPLPEKVLEYAISDTHYLLYIYAQMSKELIKKADGKSTLYDLVFENSKLTASVAYRKPLPVEVNFNAEMLNIFTPQQKLVWYRLLIWRDQLARKLDESPMYILSKLNMKKLIMRMAREVQDVCRCLESMDKRHPIFKREVMEELLNVMCIDPKNYVADLEAAGLNKKPVDKTKTDEYWFPHDCSGDNVDSDELPLLMRPPEPSVNLEHTTPDPAFMALKEVFRVTHNFLSPYERYVQYQSIAALIEEKKKKINK